MFLATFRNFTEVTGLCSHSARVQKGDVFYFLGSAKQAAPFVAEALRSGAVGVVLDYGTPLNLPYLEFDDSLCVRVSDVRACFLNDCLIFYRELFSAFRLIGVTGTKGKTTITWLIYSLLRKMGRSVALVGTNGVRYGSVVQPSLNTTLGLDEFVRLLQHLQKVGIQDVVCEISSQGLEQKRVPIPFFSIRIFTDLSPEHLDAHGNMQNYFQAKARFFLPSPLPPPLPLSLPSPSSLPSPMSQSSSMSQSSPLPQSLPSSQPQPVQQPAYIGWYLDRSTWGQQLEQLSGQDFFSFGLENQHNFLAVIKQHYSIDGCHLVISHNGRQYECHSPLVGFFNAENLLCALSVLVEQGCSLPELLKLVPDLISVAGRMELVAVYNQARVYVDYAHSSQSFEFVLTVLRELVSGRLIVVFGCGGDRDPTKRSPMGAAAAKYADVIIITDDNPRTENADNIVATIEEGVVAEIKKSNQPRKYIIQRNRRQAIAMALSELFADDVLIICGKGHEDYQIYGTERSHFSDREEVLNFIHTHNHMPNNITPCHNGNSCNGNPSNDNPCDGNPCDGNPCYNDSLP